MVKIIVICPPEAEAGLLKALGQAGLGHLGAYDCWSLSSEVVESFRPLPGADPADGQIHQIHRAPKRRLEFQCPKAQWPAMVELIKQHHPYETPAIEVLPLLHP